MKRLFFLMSLLCVLLSTTASAYDMDVDVCRLNTLLNRDSLPAYLKMKNYIELGGVSNCFYEIPLSDCEVNNDRLVITLYFYGNLTGYTLENKVDARVKTAEEICRVMNLLYWDFVGLYINRGNLKNNLKIVARNLSVLESKDNRLFTCENGKIEYFPRLFSD